MNKPLVLQPVTTLIDAEAEKSRILAKFDPDDVAKIEVMQARIWVAKWIREKQGSIFLAQQTKREDGFQGKVGIVVAVGPLAFEDDKNHDWRGQRAQPGDWVLYGYGDGHDWDYQNATTGERVPCKTLDEAHIQMVLPRPDFAY